MGVIIDRQTSIGTFYERLDSNGALIKRSGVLGFVKKSTIKKLTYFILLDLKGNLIFEANYYLNSVLENTGYKNRERAFNALKLFYSYLQLFPIKDYKERLNRDYVNGLISFLEGGYKDGVNLKLDLKTTRNKDTIASYVGVYNDFYDVMFKVNSHGFFKLRSNGFGTSNSSRKLKFKSSINEAIYNTPMYIKRHQHEEIIELVDKSFSSREKIIINLMYHYGMRIGEVLGLTLEDIEPLNNQKYKLIIRNRISDKPSQKGKNLTTPKSLRDYKTSPFTTYGNGFQTVVIDSDMAELIEEYIDETRDPRLMSRSSTKSKNLKMKAFADRIGTIPLFNDINQYIFLSHQHYTPLTQEGWNYVLKKIFKGVGIPVDKVNRSTNLSHRFRHAFAMNLVNQGVNILALQKAMRHKSIESCRAYYNPDEEDKIKIQEKYSEKSKEKYNFDE